MSKFTPLGTPLSFTAATTAPTSVQPILADGIQQTAYRIVSESVTTACVIGWGKSDAEAKANAAAINSNCAVIPAYGLIDIVAPHGSYFSGITSSSTAVMYVQPGIVQSY